MTTSDSTSPEQRDAARRKAAEALRLARIFGDVLPETTRDERGSEHSGDNDEWLRAQVPPHHG
ncbi:hypothetical protein [Nocardia sp. AG03]|uniref:hypothetical protein n=1 Tax=Nocardia sp. AG03 TaxID=3025312 RepID=UPI00241884EB|nr:hypothetical protein [Nocardia sp. AG03]